jgi:23S rRNA (uracil1939-C5)-methyltransferase
MDTKIIQEAFDSEGFCYYKEKKIKHIVLGALPSEEVSCLFLGRKRKETFSLLEEVKTPHPWRVKAPCSDVPRCGGCVFQSLDYQEQLKLKQSKIESLFIEDIDKCLAIIASPKIFGYRAKMDFSFSQNKAGDKFLGLTQAKGSGRVINTKHCHLAPDWMSKALQSVQKVFESSPLAAYDRKGSGDLRSLILREGVNTHEKMAILEVVAHKNSQLKKEDLADFFEPLKKIDPEMSLYLRIVQMIPGVPTQIYEMHLGGPLHIHETLTVDGKKFTFKISPSAFFQPNPKAAEVLINTMAKIVKSLHVKKICDLFCGTGTIGLSLSSYFESCISVEINPYAVFDAKENLELNQIKNVSFYQDDAAKFIQENTEILDLVIVDPPRAGLGVKACHMITSFQSPYLLYVSCNPVTQAQDIHILKEKGYRIALIQPLDQFPHTNHVENIILLKKTDNSGSN